MVRADPIGMHSLNPKSLALRMASALPVIQRYHPRQLSSYRMLYTEENPMGVRESDRPIVLRSGRADHMGKGTTDLCSSQRKHGPDMIGQINHANLTAGNNEQSVRK
jgi:hypothetical protein